MAKETVHMLKKGLFFYIIRDIFYRIINLENPNGKYDLFIGDVSKRDQVDNLREFYIKQFGGQSPSFLVNSAGITRDSFLVKMNDQMFDDVINVNLRSIYIVCP